MRFYFYLVVIWILLQSETEAVNSQKIQELLTNVSYSEDRLVFRKKTADPNELPTPDACKTEIKKWFNDLKMLRDGKCNASEECSDSLTQLDAFARYPSVGTPNIYEGSFRKCVGLNGKKGFRRKHCYLIHSDGKNKNCRKDYYSVLYKPNRTAFAICAPENCHGKDMASIFGNLKRPFSFMIDQPVCAVFCSKRGIPKLSMYYVFTSFVILLAGTVFFSSLYDYIRETRYRLSSESEEVFGQRAILSWSLWSNIVCLFKDNRPGYIRSLDCIRTLTFAWVVGQNVVGHLAFYDSELRVDPSRTSFVDSALSSLIPIYTYLFMSGLTVTYRFIRAKPATAILKRPITWIVFYFHRWIRLTSALMVFIGFFDAYGKYIQGPYDSLTGYSMVTQTDRCTYWKDIIHISNFVPVDEMCYLPAWHLAVDFQFTLVAPIFMIGFYVSSMLGTVLSVIAVLVSIGLTYLFFIQNEHLHAAFTGDHILDDSLIEIVLSKPWNQMEPYMMGMIVGYILAISAGSKKVLHPIATAIIWVIVIILALLSVFFGNLGTSQAERATTNVLVRTVWSLCLAWIIVSSHLKWAGPLTHFLEHPFWRPFGKLSFCAFIVHHMAMYHVFNMEEQAPRYVSFWRNTFHFSFPIVAYSYFVALFLSLIVEIPFIRLDKILLDTFIPPSSSNKEEVDENETRDEEEEKDENEELPEEEGPLLNSERFECKAREDAMLDTFPSSALSSLLPAVFVSENSEIVLVSEGDQANHCRMRSNHLGNSTTDSSNSTTLSPLAKIIANIEKRNEKLQLAKKFKKPILPICSTTLDDGYKQCRRDVACASGYSCENKSKLRCCMETNHAPTTERKTEEFKTCPSQQQLAYFCQSSKARKVMKACKSDGDCVFTNVQKCCDSGCGFSVCVVATGNFTKNTLIFLGSNR
ncbi:unnamed protein product [Caenorhabditis sp. 36 PRJEB53466]|nr:unnamed protein product [Caenorhabditis sp. 36 PRJEB53466]